MRKRSLVRKLVWRVLLAEFCCAAIFSTVAILHERAVRVHGFYAVLRGRADSLLGAVQDAEDPGDNVMVDRTELALPEEDIYAVLSPDGRVLGHSQGDVAPLLGAGSGRPDGFFRFKAGGTPYRALKTEGIRVIDRDENGGIRRPVTLLYAAPSGHMWNEVEATVQFYGLLGAALLAGSGVLIALVLRKGMSPLTGLAARAAQVSERNWSFVPPAAVLATAELAPIAEALRELLADLEKAFERERQFTGDAAHELKTSVTVLKSSLQLLTMKERTAEEYAGGLDGLLFDIERMELLIGRMLTLTRLTELPCTGSEMADLTAVAESLAARLDPLAADRGIRIEVVSSGLAAASMPTEDAEILCSNLLMNAIQHSPDRGTVRATVTLAADRIELAVADTGAGIPAEALPHVFDRFFRADASRSRRSGGAGLGLALCKAIVLRCDGRIAIESTPGAGTIVRVRLPRAATPKQV